MNRINFLTKSQFAEKGFGTVHLTSSPDGIGLLTEIRKAPDVRSLLHGAGIAIGAEDSFEIAGSPLASVAETLETLLNNRLLHNLTNNDGASSQVIVISKPLRLIVGPTLLERVFLGCTRTVAENRGFADTRVSIIDSATVQSPEENFCFEKGESCLAFAIEDGVLKVATKEMDDRQWYRYRFKRDFQKETIEAFDEAKITALGDPDLEAELQLDVNETEQYIRARTENPEMFWQLRVPRSSIVKIILELCKKLYDSHKSGKIHGDIKPANILLTPDAAELIDHLEIDPGEVSPELTRGWASPEQVLRQPVDFQSDQYPIGLMLVKLVNGVLFGEERNVIVPTGGITTEKHVILQNTGVFIDSKIGFVNSAFIKAYRRIISKCVQFDPKDRFPSIADLISELETLAQNETLRGDIILPLSFGTLVSGVNDGQESLYWRSDDYMW